jgi:hypothetical protein
MLDRDRNFRIQEQNVSFQVWFRAETDFRPALSEFAESPSGCQRRFGLLSLVRARFGLADGRAGRQEADSDKARWRHAVPINAQISWNNFTEENENLTDLAFVRRASFARRGRL